MQREHPLRLSFPAFSSLTAAPLAAGGLVVFWAVLMAAIHPAQFADSIEQYNWAHSLEWGYWKHPPLSTWMMRGAIALIGVSHWTAPLLAALCLLVSVAFMWRIACAILPPRAAELAILLWPLHQALTFRAEVYNHNTAVVLFSSAIAWTAVRAAASGRTRDWLLAGLVAGLGLLAKYQALVTVMGVIVTLGITGRLRSPALRRQLWLAAAVAFIVFLPHFLWLVHEALPTLDYVEHSARHLRPFARLPALFRFFSVQMLMVAGMLLVAAAAVFWPARRNPAPARAEPADDAARAWLIGLAGVPLVVVACAVLVAGLTPQKMWGLQTLQFLPLWLAWRIARARPGQPLVGRAAVAAAVLTAANVGYALAEAEDPQMRMHVRAVDRLMPATELAHAAMADWQRSTNCPLRLLEGGSFAAGLVSVYSGAYPPVLEEGDFTKTPWVTPRELHDRGALEVHGPDGMEDIPQGASFMAVPSSAKNANAPSAIWWRVIPPARPC